MRENAMFEKRWNRHSTKNLLDNGCEAESTHSDIGQFIFKPSMENKEIIPIIEKQQQNRNNKKSLTNGFVAL